MSRKRVLKTKITHSSSRQDDVYELSQALVHNCKAWSEGPQQRKVWSKHDIRAIQPLTIAQEDLFHAYYSGSNIVGYGSAGTGKSTIAIWLALNDILDKTCVQDKIIIVRSNVATREVGFLPGTASEKISVFERPYYDILEFLVGKSSTYEDMKAAGLIEFMPTSFVRGQTWDNSIIIIDEGQSMNWHELNSVITRLGTDSRLLLLGDIKQNDLVYKRSDTSGFVNALKVFEQIPSIAMVKFTHDDIVRSDFVKQWIIACESLNL